MNYNELREEATKIANQARALLDTITDENRAEKEAEFDRMLADSDGKYARADKLEAIEKREKALAEIATDLPESRSEARTADADRDQFAEYVRGNINERELRAFQSVGTDANGGYLVPETWANAIVKSMKWYGPMLDIASVVTTSNGDPINFPTNDDTSNTGALLAENTAVSEQETTFGNIVIGAYKYTSKMVRVSNELLADSAYDVQAHLSDLLGQRLGRIANTQLTTGTGSSQPSGIVTGSSLGVTTASATALTSDELIDLAYEVDRAYRSNGAYMMNDKTIKLVRKLKDTTNQYIWQPAFTSGEPATINGFPVYANNDMGVVPASASATKVVLFGDFKKYQVRQVAGLGLKRLNERYADYDQAAFLAFARLDGALLDSAAVKHIITKAS